MNNDIEHIKDVLKVADICDLTYDEDSYDIYKTQDDWIICNISMAADPVIGYVLANAPSWASMLIRKNEALQHNLTDKDATIEKLETALHTHKSYDKTASELHEENTRLRKALEEALERLVSNQPHAAGIILSNALGEGDKE